VHGGGAVLNQIRDQARTIAPALGLGGRLDATNVLDAKLVVLTNVSLDHTDVLGVTREQIALEKLAVIAPGAARAANGPDLNHIDVTYHGGPLLEHVQVVTLFWGQAWEGAPLRDHLNGFFQALVDDGRYLAQLSQYSAGGYQIGNGQIIATATDPAQLPARVTDQQIQAELIAQIAAGAAGGPRDGALGARARLPTTTFEYQDHVASRVAKSFSRVYDARGRTRADVRQGLVRGILRGDHGSLAPSDLITLDHDLTGVHVAVLLPAVPEGAAGQLMVGMRARTMLRQTLLHPLALNRTLVWLTSPSGWSPDRLQQLREGLGDSGVVASVSEPLTGLAGFRESFEQAADVQRVREAWGAAAAQWQVVYPLFAKFFKPETTQFSRHSTPIPPRFLRPCQSRRPRKDRANHPDCFRPTDDRYV